jgi:outer membrane lipoprotein-sorting protein
MRFWIAMGLWLAAVGTAAAGGSAADRAQQPAVPSCSERDAQAEQRRRVGRLVESMRAAVRRLRDYTVEMRMAERSDGHMPGPLRLRLKWARPYKLYVAYLDEQMDGREVIYVRGRHGDELVVHNGSFPDITVKLDPRGDMAMEGNHHPADEVALTHFVAVVADNLERALRRGEGEIELLDGRTLWGRPCTKLLWRIGGHGDMVRVHAGETLWEVADRTGRNMFLLLHHNRHRGWDEPDDPEPGDAVFVPRYYASRAEIWIDDALRLPIKAKLWDHHGQLYEFYELRDLRINVGLSDADFDPDNPRYGF